MQQRMTAVCPPRAAGPRTEAPQPRRAGTGPVLPAGRPRTEAPR
jgi:hypothetical protein